MSEQIKFDDKHYTNVKNYLNNHKDLHSGIPFGIDGKLYLTNSRSPSGFILQNGCGKLNEAMLSVISYHPSFKQIKSDLQKIIEGKNE